jgi:hypothetical protein
MGGRTNEGAAVAFVDLESGLMLAGDEEDGASEPADASRLDESLVIDADAVHAVVRARARPAVVLIGSTPASHAPGTAPIVDDVLARARRVARLSGI